MMELLVKRHKLLPDERRMRQLSNRLLQRSPHYILVPDKLPSLQEWIQQLLIQESK